MTLIRHHPSHWDYIFTYLKILFVYFWSHGTAYEILVPQPGIEPTSPALEGLSLNHWTVTEIPDTVLKNNFIFKKQWETEAEVNFYHGCPVVEVEVKKFWFVY